MYVYAASTSTTLEGGGVGLLMVSSIYANMSSTRYTRPTDPGPYSQHGPSDTTAARAYDNAIHKEERRVYNLDDKVDALLNQ